MEPAFAFATVDTRLSHEHLSRLHDENLELAFLLICDLCPRHLDLGLKRRHEVVLGSPLATITA